MRIACLQFSPVLGDVDNNLTRADAILAKSNLEGVDLLVLPELAFSGYNFKSLQHISPHLEPTTSGISSLWARTTALKHECVVIVGYPEKVDISTKWPASPEYYNSSITVNKEGETISNYRKSFLYHTDSKWALEGPDGFFDGEIDGIGNCAIGICKWPTKSFERMDLNPYKFEAPWNAWEFAYHILHRKANVVVLSMAWRTTEDGRTYHRQTKEPDMDTLAYWLARLEPVIRAEQVGEIIVVFANRTGTEEEAVYTGTSAVLGICAGEVKVYGMLGRGEKALLIADTNSKPIAKLVTEPKPPKPRQRVKGIKPPPPISTPPMASPDDIFSNITPISPVEPNTPHSYYSGFEGKRNNAPSKLDTTSSSASSFDRTPTPFPEPPAPFKPSFPPPNPPGEPAKSLPPINAQAKRLSKKHTPSASATEAQDNVTFPRPSSPKSRNASRTRQHGRDTSLTDPVIVTSEFAAESIEPAVVALLKGVLEEKIKVDTVANSSRSGTAQSFTNSHVTHLRTNSRSQSPRPKSTGW